LQRTGISMSLNGQLSALIMRGQLSPVRKAQRSAFPLWPGLLMFLT